MKNNNYITITGWMVNELSLSGNDLICYAIIYGFSQYDNYWEGSQSYLSEWLGVSKRATVEILKRLLSDGHIIKQEYEVNKVKFCKYKAIAPKLMDSKESSPNNNSGINKEEEKRDKSLSEKDSKIDFSAILKKWKEFLPNLPQPRCLNNKRKDAIRKTLKNNNANVDDLFKAFEIMSVCSFFHGNNSRNWKASFDWLINDTKSCFNRVLEGSYAKDDDEKEKCGLLHNDDMPNKKQQLVINGVVYR